MKCESHILICIILRRNIVIFHNKLSLQSSFYRKHIFYYCSSRFCCRVSQPVSSSPSDVESIVDSAPAGSGSTKYGLGDDVQFGIRRLMEDLGILI
jgi:hypothetical protein